MEKDFLVLYFLCCSNLNHLCIHDTINLSMPSLLATISSFSISELEFEDTLAWRNVENGKLTIKIGYEMIKIATNSDKWKTFS